MGVVAEVAPWMLEKMGFRQRGEIKGAWIFGWWIVLLMSWGRELCERVGGSLSYEARGLQYCGVALRVIPRALLRALVCADLTARSRARLIASLRVSLRASLGASLGAFMTATSTDLRWENYQLLSRLAI